MKQNHNYNWISIPPAIYTQCNDFARAKVESGTNNNHYNKTKDQCIETWTKGKLREYIFMETVRTMKIPCTELDLAVVTDIKYKDSHDFLIHNTLSVDVKGCIWKSNDYFGIDDFLNNQTPVFCRKADIVPTKHLYSFVYLEEPDLKWGYVFGYILYSEIPKTDHEFLTIYHQNHIGFFLSGLHNPKDLVYLKFPNLKGDGQKPQICKPRRDV